MKTKITLLSAAMLLLGLLSCKDYLDAKPDKKLAAPNTLEDLQALLNDNVRLNAQMVYAGEVAADNFFVKDVALKAVFKQSDVNIYNWERQNQFEEVSNSWQHTYTIIYYGNTVLENITKLERNPSNAKDWDNIKGQAHAFKGMALLQASVVWCNAYSEENATTDLGLVIRENTDFNVKSERATLMATYQQLIYDLKQAAQLLPVVQVHPMRPSKLAAYALLSRAYLAMNKYEEAGLYADSVLQLNPTLLDYNTLVATAANPFTPYKGEVLFHLNDANPEMLNQTNALVLPELYQQYHTDDLRKKVFFRAVGTDFSFKGNYTGGTSHFFGLAVDEMYLNRAESYARQNKLALALADLNTLMLKRWDKNKTYLLYASNNQTVVIDWILAERRKELLMRGLRWSDVKRLNKLGYQIELKRNQNESQSVLPPNDKRFAMPLPEYIVGLAGLQQNP